MKLLSISFILFAMMIAIICTSTNNIEAFHLHQHDHHHQHFRKKNLQTPQTQQPQIGNGYVATFINSTRVYISGLYSGQTDQSNRAPLPSTILCEPEGGIPVVNTNISGSGASSIYNQDMNTGEAWANWLVPESTGFAPPNCVFGHKRYVHRVYKNVFIEELSVSWENSQIKNQSAVYRIPINFQQGPVDTNRIKRVNVTQKIVQDGPNPGDTTYVWIETYVTLVPEVPGMTSNNYAVIVRETPPDHVSVRPSYGGMMSDQYPGVIVTTLPYDAFATRSNSSQTLADVAVAMWINYTSAANPQQRSQEHRDAWKSLWESGSVSYTSSSGDVSITNAVHASQYALFCSLRADWPYSTSPGGLPDNYYESSVFWDMETWMAPSLLMFHPEIVRGSTIQYRLDRLQGALQNAQANVLDKSTGVKCPSCAAFPWQSCYSGESCCPWNQGTQSEIHITADVVLLWRQYYLLTNDRSTLQAMWPLLKRTADFWVARSTSSSDGKVHINNVTPPDEYHFGDDSVYTNYAAARAVDFTVNASIILGYYSDSDPTIQSWKNFVSNINILYDTQNDYHPEFSGYKGDQVKQADVILLNYPLGMQMESSNTARNDLIYYGQRTNPQGPAMTWAMFSVGYNSIGDRAMGTTYFYQGYKQNVFPPFYQWSEVAGGSGCPNFITGAGGFLQSVIFGLTSMRITDENNGLFFDLSKVNLPVAQDVVTLNNLHYQGSTLTITFTASDSSFTTVTATFTLNSRTTSDGGIQVALNDKPMNVGQAVPVVYRKNGGDSTRFVTLSLT